MHSDKYFQAAKTILDYRGEVQSTSIPKYILVEFEDNRIKVQGTVEISTMEFERMAIALKLKSTTPSGSFYRVTPFAIPNQRPIDETLVYYWEKTNRYFREGRWCQFVEMLAADINAQLERNDELNKRRVDDADLFPEFRPQG